MADTAERERAIDTRRDERRAWWAWFAVVLVLCLAWDAATPLFGAPDEGGHVPRAAEIGRGHLSDPEVFSVAGYVTLVHVPAQLPAMNGAAACFRDQPTVTPRCAPPVHAGTKLVESTTGMGTYPPLYYFVLAPVTRVSTSRLGVYVMRFIAALLCAALLASAFVSARLLGGWAVLGVAAAVTPMVLYLAGVVNPSGLELASAVCLWATMAAIARGPGPQRRLVIRAVIAFVVLANTRSLSLPMAAVAVVAPLLMATPTRLRAIAASHAVRIGGVVALAGVAASAVWTAFYSRVPTIPWVHIHFTVADGLGRSWTIFEESVAWFGYFEVRDLAAIGIWAVVWGALLVLALRRGHLRDGAVLLGVVVSALAFPIAVSMVHPAPIYDTWQGRHGLPLWAGLPVLAGAIVSGAPPRARATRLGIGALAALMAYGHVSAFATAAHRYVVGVNRRRLYFLDPVWSGPVSPALLLAVVVLGCLAFLALCAASGSRRALLIEDP